MENGRPLRPLLDRHGALRAGRKVEFLRQQVRLLLEGSGALREVGGPRHGLFKAQLEDVGDCPGSVRLRPGPEPLPEDLQRVPIRPGQLRVIAYEDLIPDEDLEGLRRGRLFEGGFLQVPVVAGEGDVDRGLGQRPGVEGRIQHAADEVTRPTW
jgi:hypothetical protein